MKVPLEELNLHLLPSPAWQQRETTIVAERAGLGHVVMPVRTEP